MNENGVATLICLAFVGFLFWGLIGSQTTQESDKMNGELRLMLVEQTCRADVGVFNKTFNTCVKNGDVVYDLNSIYEFLNKDEREK